MRTCVAVHAEKQRQAVLTFEIAAQFPLNLLKCKCVVWGDEADGLRHLLSSQSAMVGWRVAASRALTEVRRCTIHTEFITCFSIGSLNSFMSCCVEFHLGRRRLGRNADVGVWSFGVSGACFVALNFPVRDVERVRGVDTRLAGLIRFLNIFQTWRCGTLPPRIGPSCTTDDGQEVFSYYFRA